MKKIKVALSIAVSAATMAVIGMSGSQVAFADGGRCDCQSIYGYYGILINGDCVDNQCYIVID